MKKLLYTFIIVLTSMAGGLTAQTVDPAKGAELLQVTPKEKMFVHYNSSVLFPGEYLYYKTYTLNAANNGLSDISKVAYLELVGENGEQVFQHLIPLENGQGHGDFFIPTTLPSGSYKLLGYTNWMRNTGNHFRADLVVINPYRGDQSTLTPAGTETDATQNFKTATQLAMMAARESTSRVLSVDLDKDLYGPREKVSLRLGSLKDQSLSGTYSVSVRKLDSISNPKRPASQDISRESTGSLKTGDIFLPEFRGNLISGSISPKNAQTSRSLANVKIAFSVPGEHMLYKVATTDGNGNFRLSFDEVRTNPQLLLQIIGEDRNIYDLKLHEFPAIPYSNLEFVEFHITPAMQQWILDRSVNNQIENAYYNQKPDTIITSQLETPFYVKKPELYLLDDYNRFPTIKETFVEIIKSSYLGKNNQGEEILIVREPNGGRNFGLPALLLVDGVMVQDHANFIAYPAKQVESIGIIRDNYFLGSHIFEGIIDVRTFDGQFWKQNPEDYVYEEELKVPELQKNYFQQIYTDSTRSYTDHIPDLRSQLLWNPEVRLDKEDEAVFEFFTSDVPGTYQVEFEGFTHTGKPVSVRSYFKVEEEIF